MKQQFLWIAAPLMLVMLSACATSGDSVKLAVMPADLRLCFDRLVPRPPGAPGTPLTRAQIAKLIADLKRSEASKAACGKRLRAWIDDQAEVFAK